jgi:hypothetical protein
VGENVEHRVSVHGVELGENEGRRCLCLSVSVLWAGCIPSLHDQWLARCLLYVLCCAVLCCAVLLLPVPYLVPRVLSCPVCPVLSAALRLRKASWKFEVGNLKFEDRAPRQKRERRAQLSGHFMSLHSNCPAQTPPPTSQAHVAMSASQSSHGPIPPVPGAVRQPSRYVYPSTH